MAIKTLTKVTLASLKQILVPEKLLFDIKLNLLKQL